MTLGIAVLGTGRIGGNYINVVKATDGCELRAVAEPREEQVAPLKQQHPDLEFVADYRDALTREDVDIVIGTLPHWLHCEASVDAVNAGKHVYLEKPMALSVAECDEMLAAARANRRLLMTAHTQRYYPEVRKMKEIVDSKQLGKLVMANAMWVKPLEPGRRPPWMLERPKGGGMGLMDGTHLIDRLIWLIGPDIHSVSGITSNFTHPKLNADDSGMHFLRWKSGVTAAITRMGYRTGVTEYGADFYFADGQAKHRRAYGRVGETGVWIGRDGEWKPVPIEDINSLQVQFADFAAAVRRGDRDSPIPMAHGRRVMQVFEATEQSHETGQEVILT